jgi:amino-acid N-acetyltransferase
MNAVPAVLVRHGADKVRAAGRVRCRGGARLVRPASGRNTIIRAATLADVDAVYDLITANLSEGHLLPRRSEEIAAHIGRFVIATRRGNVVACADLAPLSRAVAEVRSLIVSEQARFGGIGRRLLDELIARASTAGFEKVCAFTHSPSYFVGRGFSIVPHVWLPEKISTDCNTCAQFRHCGQYAVMLPLVGVHTSDVPLASLHG